MLDLDGEEAGELLRACGLDDFPPLFSPVYHALLRAIGKLFCRHSVYAVFAVNSFFALLAILLLIRLLYRCDLEPADEAAHPRLLESFRLIFGSLGVSVAVAWWALGFPFVPSLFAPGSQWLDIFLILACARALFLFDAADSRWCRTGWLAAFSFLAGILCLESATGLLALPILLCWLLASLFRDWFRLRRAPPILAPTLCFALGLAPFLAYAAWYAGQPAFKWRGFDGVGQVLAEMARVHYLNIVAGVPRVGWLTILLLYLIPFVYLLVWPPRLNSRNWFKRTLPVHLALSGLCVFIVLIPWLWEGLAYNLRPHLLLPSLLVAITAGALAEAWSARLGRSRSYDSPRVQLVRRALFLAMRPALAVLIILSGAISLRAQIRSWNPLPMRFATDVVASLDGRDWLISDGVFDDAIKLAAYRAGVHVNVLSPPMFQALPYRRLVSTRLRDPIEQRMAILGLPALLTCWMSQGSNIQSRVAVLANPSPWVASGQPFFTSGPLYLGGVGKSSCCWTQYLPYAASRSNALGRARFWNEAILLHMSRLANNAGWNYEREGKTSDALAAYGMARLLLPHNVSAILNQISLSTEDKASLFAELQSLIRSTMDPTTLQSLGQFFGYVSHTEVLVKQGYDWAASGDPGADGQRRGTDYESLLRYSVAEGDRGQATLVATRILEVDGENAFALLVLGSVYLSGGENHNAEMYFRRSLAKARNAAVLNQLACALERLDRTEEALVYAKEAICLDESLAEIWKTLADIQRRMGQIEDADNSSQRAQTLTK